MKVEACSFGIKGKARLDSTVETQIQLQIFLLCWESIAADTGMLTPCQSSEKQCRLSGDDSVYLFLRSRAILLLHLFIRVQS